MGTANKNDDFANMPFFYMSIIGVYLVLFGVIYLDFVILLAMEFTKKGLND